MGCLCGAGERSPSPPWSYFDSLCGATWKTLDTPVCTLWWPEGCERCTMVPPGGPPVQEHDYRPQIGSLYQIILPPASGFVYLCALRGLNRQLALPGEKQQT
ncbi:uncharacterized protein RBU33_028384 isoform 2-T4 [Hipposideros larvatus]